MWLSAKILVTQEVMYKIGFACGLWTHVFSRIERKQQTYVYGNTFVIKGLRRELHEIFDQLMTRMLAKGEGVPGPDSSQGDVS